VAQPKLLLSANAPERDSAALYSKIVQSSRALSHRSSRSAVLDDQCHTHITDESSKATNTNVPPSILYNASTCDQRASDGTWEEIVETIPYLRFEKRRYQKAEEDGIEGQESVFHGKHGRFGD
jgi:hypothetical protein